MSDVMPEAPLAPKPDFAHAAIAGSAPQPSKAVSAAKGWRAMVVGFVTVVVWEAIAAALPALTPDVLQVLVARAVAAYPSLALVKGVLFLALLGAVRGLQTYIAARAQAMQANRAAPGVVNE